MKSYELASLREACDYGVALSICDAWPRHGLTHHEFDIFWQAHCSEEAADSVETGIPI